MKAEQDRIIASHSEMGKIYDKIRQAAENGHLEVVKYLVSEGADIYAWEDEALRWAASNGHLEVVKLLLADPRVDPSAKNNYAVCYASLNDHSEIVKLLKSDPRVRRKL